MRMLPSSFSNLLHHHHHLRFTPSPETRRRLHESSPTWHVQLAIRSIAAVLSLVAMSTAASAIPPWNRHFYHSSGPGSGDWQDGLLVAPLLLSLLQYLFCTAYLFAFKRMVPLGVTVVCDLVVWALLVPAITFASWNGLFNVWRPAAARRESDGSVICSGENLLSRECSPILYSVGELELCACVVGVLVWCFHFGFFVWGIREIRKRGKKARISRYQSFQRDIELETQRLVKPSTVMPEPLSKEFELNEGVRKPVAAAMRRDVVKDIMD